MDASGKKRMIFQFMQHTKPLYSNTSPKQQRRPLPSLLSDSYSMKRRYGIKLSLPFKVFFSSFEPKWALDQGVTVFSIWLGFCQVIWILSIKKWLRGVSDPRESCFGGFFTPLGLIPSWDRFANLNFEQSTNSEPKSKIFLARWSVIQVDSVYTKKLEVKNLAGLSF